MTERNKSLIFDGDPMINLRKFDLRDKLSFPLLFVMGSVVTFAFSFFLSPVLNPVERLTTVLTFLTTIGGLTGFLYARHAQELQIFRDLFREFNSRYDSLNERLNEIHDRPMGEPLRPDKDANNKSDKDVLYDYFNLCAEEHMYADAGYVDPRVWTAWQVGMAYFDTDPEIREFWESELEKQKKSYYGFSLEKIRKA